MTKTGLEVFSLLVRFSLALLAIVVAAGVGFYAFGRSPAAGSLRPTSGRAEGMSYPAVTPRRLATATSTVATVTTNTATPAPPTTPAPTPTRIATPHPTAASMSASDLTKATGHGHPASSGTAPYYVVIMVLDGARPDYFNVSDIPHVKALIRQGTSFNNAFDGVLESETPTGHAAIASGSYPRHDGILSFGWPNPQGHWVSIFNSQYIQAHVLENLMTGAPTIAGMLHRKYPKAVVAAEGSYKYYANDALGGPDSNITLYFGVRSNGTYGPVFVQGHEPPASLLNDKSLILPTSQNLSLGVNDHYAMKLAAATFEKTRARVIMLNIPEFDWPLGHLDGANRDPSAVRTLMSDYDRDLAMLENVYKKAGIFKRTLWVITADHGFGAINHQISSTVFTDAVQSAGLTVTHGGYHSAAYLWVNDPSRANLAASAIAQLGNPGVQAVYFKEQIPGGYDYVRASGPGLFDVLGMEQANQELLQSFADAVSPDIVVAMREGWVASIPSQSNWKGDHGGLDWDAQHIPLIISGPGIKRNHLSRYPARLIDIAPTVLSLLHASHSGMDGTPLATAMIHPPAQAVQAEDALRPRLDQVVSSLRAEARAERAAG